jgi:3'(2'), 5'-bisphosphate nucleotidase
MLYELEVAIDLAIKAGKRVMEFYNDKSADTAEWQKNDKTYVTQADLESNSILIKGLSETFPTHSILSEEGDDDKERLHNSDVWIIDPLDGTSDFRARTGDFSVMIAYTVQKRPVLGVVYAPAHGKIYAALKGSGAHVMDVTEKGCDFNSQRKLCVSSRTLDESVIMLSRKEFTPEQADEMTKKFGMKGYIQAGSMGIKVGRIIEGVADLYVNNDPKAGEWDACAPGLILDEAGGIMTDYDGAEIKYNKDKPYLPRGAVCTSSVMLLQDVLKNVERYILLKKRDNA